MKRWHAFVIWLIGSLLAIAVIGDYLTAGLIIAIVTGIVFGVVNFLSWQQTK